MKKKISLFLLPLLLLSCAEEEAAPDFLDKTVWTSIVQGTEVDQADKFVCAYTETHTLTFGEDSFTYAMTRQEINATAAGYKDKPEKGKTDRGTYTVQYPEIILNAPNYHRIGLLSTSVLIINTESGDEAMLFSRKKK